MNILKIVLQRVNHASVTIDGRETAKIGKGYLILLGIGKDDTKEIADGLIAKIKKLRLFSDSEGKTNLSIGDVCGSVLVVSQFTLYANCKKGTRPSFADACDPVDAKMLYTYFLEKCYREFESVSHGEFGADMKINLENDGPFTILLES